LQKKETLDIHDSAKQAISAEMLDPYLGLKEVVEEVSTSTPFLVNHENLHGSTPTPMAEASQSHTAPLKRVDEDVSTPFASSVTKS